ncbi:MAG TPA: hypothetical protein VM450_04520, partial [Thermomicrobiales bacterium]|nr:hypothetical protein [Thermomicrobiales bacterium]
MLAAHDMVESVQSLPYWAAQAMTASGAICVANARAAGRLVEMLPEGRPQLDDGHRVARQRDRRDRVKGHRAPARQQVQVAEPLDKVLGRIGRLVEHDVAEVVAEMDVRRQRRDPAHPLQVVEPEPGAGEEGVPGVEADADAQVVHLLDLRGQPGQVQPVCLAQNVAADRVAVLDRDRDAVLPGEIAQLAQCGPLGGHSGR